MARADRMIARAMSAKTLDAVLAVSLALRQLRSGLAITAPTDAAALGAIAQQLASLVARLDDIEPR